MVVIIVLIFVFVELVLFEELDEEDDEVEVFLLMISFWLICKIFVFKLFFLWICWVVILNFWVIIYKELLFFIVYVVVVFELVFDEEDDDDDEVFEEVLFVSFSICLMYSMFDFRLLLFWICCIVRL